ncbi:hypothetical protein NKG94_38905 [Micromonospora sp. M12]
MDGAVWRGDLRTGRGSVLIPGTPGTDKAGSSSTRRADSGPPTSPEAAPAVRRGHRGQAGPLPVHR